MENVKKTFEKLANEFDELIIKLIPHYNEMLEALALSIPYEKTESIKVMDLGCGTGTVSKMIREQYPNAIFSCVDLAENMIEMAKIKLGNDRVTYKLKDFYHLMFDQDYDVIISSLALHHLLTDNDKKDFYFKIYNNLAHNGVFFNADIVLGANDKLESRYLHKWKEFMYKNVSVDEVDNKVIPRHNDEDHPSRLTDQLNWLLEIGFVDVDVIWKYYNFAVYGGFKP